MPVRKIIVYQRYATKPVILTDASDITTEEIQKSILNILSSDKISILETTNDILYIRPSEIQSILITKGNIENIDPELIEPQKDSKKKQDKNYTTTLNMEKKP